MNNNKQDSLARRTMSNVFWLGGSQVLRQGVSIVATIFLARYLAPSDYGVFAMTMFVSELAQMLINFGMGTILVQRKDVDQVLLSSCFWINIGAGALVASVLVFSGPWIALYFSQPILQWLVIASALNLLIAVSATLPQVLLSRELNFRAIAEGSLFGSLAGSTCAVILALSGFGVWALVLQPPLGTLINTIYLYLRARWRPSWVFNFTEIRGLLVFSGQLLGSNVLGHINRNLLRVILGPMMGATALGLITMSQTVTWLPLSQISQTIVRATFPVFARMQDDWGRLRPALYSASGVIGLIAFPLLAGICMLAPDLMWVVFGAQWMDAVPLLRVFSLAAMIQCATTLTGSVLLAAGRADRQFLLDLLSLPITAGVLWLNRNAPLLQVVFACACVAVFFQVCALAFSLQVVRGRWADYLRPFWRPVVGCCLMSGVLYLVHLNMDSYAAFTRLISLSIIGAVFYIGWAFWADRAMTMKLVNLVRNRSEKPES